MADTLRNLSDARALLPDNSTNLISPQDVREYLLALEPDRGGASFHNGPVRVPLTVNVWTELNAATLPGMIGFENPVRWSVDGQARPIPAWGSEVVVPVTLKRGMLATGIVSVDPLQNNDDTFELAVSIGGVVREDTAEIFRITENGEIATVTIIDGGAMPVDGSLYVALAVRNVSASRDINVHTLAMLAQSYAYETDPP